MHKFNLSILGLTLLCILKGTLLAQTRTLYHLTKPPIEGFVEYQHPRPLVICDHAPGIDIISDSSFAYNYSPGMVMNLFHFGDSYIILISSENQTFFLYRNIKIPWVRKGQIIDKNSVIGALQPDEFDERKYMLSFEIWKGQYQLSIEEMLAYLDAKKVASKE